MSSSPHPIFVLAVLGIVVSVILLVTVFRVRRVGLKLLLVMISVLALAPAGLLVVMMHPDWVDERFRTYKAFYEGIQPGMTRQEVLSLQSRLYPAEGPRLPPRILVDQEDHLTFFMDPEKPGSTVNAEAILLDIKDGKVTAKTYSPD